MLVDAVAPTSWWLPRMHGIALDRLPSPERETLAAFDPAALAEPDPQLHSDYARAYAPAWFAELELAPLFTPPPSLSPTGATVAARLRREGYDWTARLRVRGLGRLGVGESDFASLVADARGTSMRTNPIELTDEEVESILQASL